MGLTEVFQVRIVELLELSKVIASLADGVIVLYVKAEAIMITRSYRKHTQGGGPD